MISIHVKTDEKLRAVGQFGDTYDTLILRLVEFWKENH